MSKQEVYFIRDILYKAADMLLLSYFAVHAPEPSKEEIQIQKMHDLNKAHHNDKFIAREDMQIKCELRYKWANMMIKVR